MFCMRSIGLGGRGGRIGLMLLRMFVACKKAGHAVTERGLL